MKKAVMGLIGAMMVFSLAACTPTTEKNKTGEVKQLETGSVTSTQGPGVVTDRNGDPNEPELEIISVYTVSEDGSKVEGTMDSVETLEPQVLADLLAGYGVLEEGTKVVSFEAEGEPSSQEVGPGVAAIPGVEQENNLREYGTLVLDKFPEDQREMKLQATANTFIENMNVVYLTIEADGETLAENLKFVEAGK